MCACGGLSLLFANRDTQLARGRKPFEKSLDFWREAPRRLIGRDKKFEDLFGEGTGFELLALRVMYETHGGCCFPNLLSLTDSPKPNRGKEPNQDKKREKDASDERRDRRTRERSHSDLAGLFPFA